MTRDLEAYPKITEDPHYSTMATLPGLKKLKTLRDLSADAPNEELIEDMPIAGGSVKLLTFELLFPINFRQYTTTSLKLQWSL